MSCNLSSGIAERAAEKAKLELLYELVHDELITLQVGADEAGLTEEEFEAGMDAYYARFASK